MRPGAVEMSGVQRSQGSKTDDEWGYEKVEAGRRRLEDRAVAGPAVMESVGSAGSRNSVRVMMSPVPPATRRGASTVNRAWAAVAGRAWCHTEGTGSGRRR